MLTRLKEILQAIENGRTNIREEDGHLHFRFE
jgi:hypothetical protein